MNIQFGSGVLFGVPNAGNLALNPTPQKFGVLQETSVMFKADLKKLFGQSQFPVATARGKIDVSGKGKIATFDPNLLNQTFFGQTAAAGQKRIVVDEAHSIPAVSTYTVTVTNSATFVDDLGVTYAATGQRFTKLANGTPAVGEYTEAAGVYTFAAADTGLAVLVSYSWTDSTTGTTITLANQLMGYAPELTMFLFTAFRGKQLAIQLNSCIMGQISIPSKQEDFWVSDIDFEANTDASNTLGYLYADSY